MILINYHEEVLAGYGKNEPQYKIRVEVVDAGPLNPFGSFFGVGEVL